MRSILRGECIKAFFLVTLFLIPTLSYSDEPQARCHLFLKHASPVVVGLEKNVLVRFDSKKFCKNTPAKNFHCYSYYEDKETCNSNNDGLVKLYIKDLIADGIVIP